MNSKSANEAIRITNEDREVVYIKMAQSKLSFCNETNFFDLFRKHDKYLCFKASRINFTALLLFHGGKCEKSIFWHVFCIPYEKIFKGVIFVGNDQFYLYLGNNMQSHAEISTTSADRTSL